MLFQLQAEGFQEDASSSTVLFFRVFGMVQSLLVGLFRAPIGRSRSGPSHRVPGPRADLQTWRGLPRAARDDEAPSGGGHVGPQNGAVLLFGKIGSSNKQ